MKVSEVSENLKKKGDLKRRDAKFRVDSLLHNKSLSLYPQCLITVTWKGQVGGVEGSLFQL